MRNFLDNLKGVSIPKEISEAEFLETGLNKVVNKNTFLSHLKSKSDAKTRLKYLNLIAPTLQEADIKLNVLGKNKEVRNAYLKAFQYDKNGERKLFFTLITEQDDSYLITAYPISKIKEVERIIKNAKNVEYIGRPTEALGTATEKNASSLNGSISQIENKIKHLNNEMNEIGENRKDLEEMSGTGRIDLVWGDDSFGLKHILEQRTAQWGEEKALQFINVDLARIIKEAQVYKNEKGKIELITQGEMVVLGKGYDNRFIITAFKDRRSKERIKSVGKQQILDDVDFTSKSVSEQLKVDDILLQNHDNIIPQKNNQSQALDMNDDSALKALKNEVSNTKESEIENNTSSQDYQTELLKHKRQRR